MHTDDVVQCSFVCFFFKVIRILPINRAVILCSYQESSNWPLGSAVTVYRLGQQTNSFLEIVASLRGTVTALCHFAAIFFWYYRPAIFTPKSMNKMLKRTIFLHINTFHKIYNHLHCFETNFSINLLFVLRQHLNQLTAAFILVALQENLVFLSAVFDQPFRWQLA